MPRTTARKLAKLWNINAQHAPYRRDGTWHHLLQRFPGALLDAYGYVLFETEGDLRRAPGILIGSAEKNWLNVPAGIASLPGYMRVET